MLKKVSILLHHFYVLTLSAFYHRTLHKTTFYLGEHRLLGKCQRHQNYIAVLFWCSAIVMLLNPKMLLYMGTLLTVNKQTNRQAKLSMPELLLLLKEIFTTHNPVLLFSACRHVLCLSAGGHGCEGTTGTSWTNRDQSKLTQHHSATRKICK